jgi:Flp pilus assembly CpaE family ATPase
MEAVKVAEAVLLVVRLDVPALRLSRKLIRHLRDQGVPEASIRPVANRYGQKRQVAYKKAEEALGTTFATWIPDDPGAVNHALNYGQPLVQTARRAGITKRFSLLAQQLNGRVK